MHAARAERIDRAYTGGKKRPACDSLACLARSRRQGRTLRILRTVDEPIRIAISACLLGEAVCCDGGHAQDRCLVETFGRHVEWVPFCPEVEAGKGIPREPVRLVQVGEWQRLVGERSGIAWREPMEARARERVRDLADVDGAICAEGSLACCLRQVPVDSHAGHEGAGFLARAGHETHLLIPAEEAGRLHDPLLRENFVERIFAWRRLRSLLAAPCEIGRLVAFHGPEEYQLLAHSTRGYQELGRLVASAKELGAAETARRYAEGFMATLALPATRRRQANVLHHVFGHLGAVMDAGDKAELLQLIEDYRNGAVPLLVPLTLLRHFARKVGDAWLARQTWLTPHPKELALRTWT